MALTYFALLSMFYQRFMPNDDYAIIWYWHIEELSYRDH
jgi:hypothetical protein